MRTSYSSTELTRTSNNVSTTDDQDDTDVCYLQSQNGNIWDRFKEEEEDDPPELSRFQEYVLRGPRVMQKLGVCVSCSAGSVFGRCKADVSGRWGVAFDEGKEPDAVNLWVGTSKSTTTLHKGNVSRLFSLNLPFFGQRRVVADEAGPCRT